MSAVVLVCTQLVGRREVTTVAMEAGLVVIEVTAAAMVVTAALIAVVSSCSLCWKEYRP